MSLGNCRGSCVEVEGHAKVDRGSKIPNFIYFKSFTTILEASKRGKTINVLLSKLKNFANGYNLPYAYTESFACGTKSLMRGLMFETIHLLFYLEFEIYNHGR